MQAIKVACPLCQTGTSVRDPAPLGKSVHCQKCGARFTIGADDLPQAAVPVSVPPAEVPWWVDAPARAASAAPAPAKVPVAAPYHPPLVPAAVTAKPPAPAPVAMPAIPPSAAQPRGVSSLVAVGLLGGGTVAVLGLAVVLVIACFANLSADPGSGESAAPAPANAVQGGAALPKKGPALPAKGTVQPTKLPVAENHPQPEGTTPVEAANTPPADGNAGVALPVRRDRPAMVAQADGPPNKQTAQKDPFLDPIKINPPPPSNKSVVTTAKQKEIDAAIARGVAFLKSIHQTTEVKGKLHHLGTYAQDNGRALGTTALVTLALLECGVPADDPCVVAAVEYVRKSWPENTATYEISLAILLLDRVGNKKDKPAIQALALRLIHGQNSVGGWSYDCDVLNNAEATQLLAILKKTRPRLPAAVERPAAALNLPAQIRLLNPLEKTGALLPAGIDKGSTPPKKDAGLIAPQEGGDKGKDVAGMDKNGPPAPPVPLPKLGATEPAPKITVVPPQKGKDPKGGPIKVRIDKKGDDNSNSQFAMLALWAARRHDVPVEHALLLAEQRYRTTQHRESGGWAYHFQDGQQKDRPSMTCVGLLGLALGRGVATEMQLKAGYAVPKVPLLDEQASDGFLKGVAPYLQKDSVGPQQQFPQGLSLYFMWSVERVAVLYDLAKIGEHDWYLWGVNLLLPSQRANGSWQTGSYHGSNPTVDTCFALLFLKRVNLVQDLTDNLRLYMAIPDSNMKQ
jgi:hypothetical protein